MNENVSLNQDITPESTVESNPTTESNVETSDQFLEGLFDVSTDDLNVEDSDTEPTSEEATQDGESEEVQNEEETEEEGEETTEPENEVFLTIKYNGEDEQLTKEQAIELAQKGRNYDKKEQQYKELKELNERYEKAINSKAVQTLNAIANEWNMSADDFAEYLLQNNEQNKIKREIDQLRAQYPEAEDNLLLELAKANLKEKSLKQENDKAQSQANDIVKRQQAINDEINEFHNKYPDVTDNDLTEDVIKNIKEGMNVTQAWEKHLNELAKDENKRLKAELQKKEEELKATIVNAKVKKKSTGSLKGNNTSMNDSSDPFIKELFA